MYEIKEYEECLYIVEIIISTNNKRNSSDIFRILTKMVKCKYIKEEFFNKIMNDFIYFELIEKYLEPSLIDCKNIESCLKMLKSRT